MKLKFWINKKERMIRTLKAKYSHGPWNLPIAWHKNAKSWANLQVHGHMPQK